MENKFPTKSPTLQHFPILRASVLRNLTSGPGAILPAEGEGLSRKSDQFSINQNFPVAPLKARGEAFIINTFFPYFSASAGATLNPGKSDQFSINQNFPVAPLNARGEAFIINTFFPYFSASAGATLNPGKSDQFSSDNLTLEPTSSYPPRNGPVPAPVLAPVGLGQG